MLRAAPLPPRVAVRHARAARWCAWCEAQAVAPGGTPARCFECSRVFPKPVGFSLAGGDGGQTGVKRTNIKHSGGGGGDKEATKLRAELAQVQAELAKVKATSGGAAPKPSMAAKDEKGDELKEELDWAMKRPPSPWPKAAASTSFGRCSIRRRRTVARAFPCRSIGRHAVAAASLRSACGASKPQAQLRVVPLSVGRMGRLVAVAASVAVAVVVVVAVAIVPVLATVVVVDISFEA